MDWLTFISSVMDSLAWPAVVCFFIWMFHEKIGSLLPRLIRLKHKDTEIEFSKAVEELEGKVVRPTEILADANHPEEVDQQFFELSTLAQLSPRAAIMEAWLKVEGAAARAAVRAYPELEAKQLRGPAQPLRLLEGKVLTKDETRQIAELRRLRNMAAHDEEFDLGGHPVDAYIDMALSMTRRLENYDS